MSIKGIVFTLGLIFLSLNAAPASAQQAVLPCGERAEIVEQLTNNFSETPVSMGLTKDGAVLEMFVSKDRTFTVVVTQPSGISCLVASGGSWENLESALAGFKI
tara:strand:- start:956 stop:1267 length:312 start_codon:yes stop_codon:yes gene_type:complete